MGIGDLYSKSLLRIILFISKIRGYRPSSARHAILEALLFTCKIFDTMISPILTYNSKVWGLFIKSDFKYWDTSPTEKGHLQLFASEQQGF